MGSTLTRHLLSTLPERIHPSHTAVLVVDMQNDYISEGGTAHRKLGTVAHGQPIIAPNKALLSAARGAGVLVAYIQMTLDYPELRLCSDVEYESRLRRYGTMPMCVPGTWGHAVVDELAPQPGDMIVAKHRPCAFTGTDMDMLLRSNHIRSVIVTGVVTHGCVNATARGAQLRDYYTTVVSDCVASPDKAQHDAALFLLERALPPEGVVPAQRIIDEWATLPSAAVAQAGLVSTQA